MIALDELRAALEQIPGIRLAVPFGSVARGTAGTRSDIDLGVALAPGIDISPHMRVALERASGRRVDLIRLDEAPPLLRFEIARDGVVVSETHPHAWADFRAHAMIDWWDWAPTARMMHRVMSQRLREEAGRGSATFRKMLTSGRGVLLVAPDLFTAERARDLLWVDGINCGGGADAIHIATALEQGCEEFLTTNTNKGPAKPEAAAKLAKLNLRVIQGIQTGVLPPSYTTPLLGPGGPKPA